MNEMPKKDSFLVDRRKSLGYAFKGFFLLISTEKAVQVHLFLAIIFIILGFTFNISVFEWMIQLLAIGLILTAEGLNTAIEELCDFVHIEFNEKIGLIKDISAGAVTFAAVFGYIILLILYINKLLF